MSCVLAAVTPGWQRHAPPPTVPPLEPLRRAAPASRPPRAPVERSLSPASEQLLRWQAASTSAAVDWFLPGVPADSSGPPSTSVWCRHLVAVPATCSERRHRAPTRMSRSKRLTKSDRDEALRSASNRSSGPRGKWTPPGRQARGRRGQVFFSSASSAAFFSSASSVAANLTLAPL